MAGFLSSGLPGKTRQRFQETEEDRITRESGHFPDFEKTMPALKYRLKYSLKDNLTSYLGSKNPIYTIADPKKHEVWLLDNTAFQTRAGKWKAEFVAAYFIRDSGEDLGDIVAWISEKVGLAKGDKQEATISERLSPMLDTILPAHAVKIDLEGKPVRLGPSGRDGISSDPITLKGTNYKNGQVITTKLVNGPASTQMNTIFAEPEGWAIISDIDDTIKKTLTPDPVGILKTTFAEEPEPIKGMPELYKYINQKLQAPAWFYLTASPYNLYPFLRKFRDLHYPPGTMILREASWMNLAGFLANLTQGTQAYKVDRMQKIHEWLPKRKIVCIGDSTQSDPESIGEMYRLHPQWIKAIYIRRVTGVAEMNDGKKNSPERFEKAFEGVPREIWHVFDDASELYERFDALVNAAPGPEIKAAVEE